MTCSVCRSFNSISLRHYSLEYCKCRRSSVHVPFNLKCLSSTTIEHWRSKVMNPQISFDNLRPSIFEFRLRAYFCIFGTTFLYPKHLKHILHHLQRTKKLDLQAYPLGRDPKCRKGKIVFPVELSKVLLIYRLHWRAAYNCESYKYRISEVKDLDNLRFSLVECTAQFHSSNT